MLLIIKLKKELIKLKNKATQNVQKTIAPLQPQLEKLGY
jgi:hypothetical protein